MINRQINEDKHPETTNSMIPSAEAIDEFWRWFVAHLDLASKAFGGDHLSFAYQIGLAIEGLGTRVEWELGPGLGKSKSLTISPDGNLSKLPVTEAIVARAPKIKGWEFHSVKPPRQWQYVMHLEEKGKKITADCKTFQYQIAGYNNGEFYDIDLFYDDLPRMGDFLRHLLGVLIVESCLGERVMMTKIGKVQLLDRKECRASGNLTHIKYLNEHFQSLITKQT